MKQPYYLIVDDDAIVRFIARKILTDAVQDAGIMEAIDGKQAIEVVRKSGLPSLLLLDLNMPVMNGFEVLEHFSSDPFLSTAPIAIITSSILQSDKLKCQHYKQVIAYLRKPFSPEDFKMVLDKLKAA